MLFTLVRDVKAPKYSSDLAAGIDFYIPRYSDAYAKELSINNPDITINGENITLAAHGHVCIPSGVKVILNDDEFMRMTNKSGVALKKRLDTGACIIDADYRGEIHLHMINTSDHPVDIEFDTKIVQGIVQKYIKTNMSQISLDEYERYKTDRGEGAFGSTGIK